MKNNFFVIVCIFSVFLCFTGCKDDNGEKDVLATGITVSPSNLDDRDLKIGDEIVLTAMVAPEGASDKGFNWMSDNVNVATVEANGLTATVKCIANGKTNIIVYNANNVRATIPIEVGANTFFDLANVPNGRIDLKWAAVDGVNQYNVILRETKEGPVKHTFGPFTGTTASIMAITINSEVFPNIDNIDDIAPPEWKEEPSYPEAKKFWKMEQISEMKKSFYWNVTAAGSDEAIGNDREMTLVKILPPTYVGVSNVSTDLPATVGANNLQNNPLSNIHTILTLLEPDSEGRRRISMKINLYPDEVPYRGAMFGWCESLFIFILTEGGTASEPTPQYWGGELSFIGHDNPALPFRIITNGTGQAVNLVWDGNSAFIRFRWIGPYFEGIQYYHQLIDFEGERINFLE